MYDDRNILTLKKSWSFKKIDEAVARIEEAEKKKVGP